MPRKPTLAQVAALAGVSKMTASRALRDAGFAVWNVEYRRTGEAGGGTERHFTEPR